MAEVVGLGDKRALYVSVQDLARATGMNLNYWYAAIAKERIKSVRFGKTIRVPRAEFERIIGEGLPAD